MRVAVLMPDIGLRAIRWRALAIAFVLVALPFVAASAQRRAAVAVGASAPAERYQIAREAVAVPNEDTWRTRDLWKWVGIGALVGAAATATWAGVRMAQSNGEAIGVSPVTILVVAGGVGGVGGGIGGALAYALAHPKPLPAR